MVKERPILFKGPMVRPILNMKPGVWPPEAIDPSKPIKYHTRRVFRNQPHKDSSFAFMGWPGKGKEDQYGAYFLLPEDMWLDKDHKSHEHFKCPYGRPGDRLWVRETWQSPFEMLEKLSIDDPDEIWKVDHEGGVPHWSTVNYRATHNQIMSGFGIMPWKPSIFMPRWASRINLEITAIRVERVQDITEADALNEGIEKVSQSMGRSAYPMYGELFDKLGQLTISPQYSFQCLWDSINAKPKPRYARIDGKRVITHYESYPWAEGSETREHRGQPWHVHGNPMIWDVEFKRV